MGRGCIDTLPKALKDEGLNYYEHFSQEELRFIPYLHYLAINSTKINRRKCSMDDLSFASAMVSKKLIKLEPYVEILDKNFWDFMCNCLFYSYNKKEIT